jgi:hypothetical protein
MIGLQVQLVLGLLAHGAQVRAQSRFGDRLGVVVVVLLPLRERTRVLGRGKLSRNPPCTAR